MEQHVAIDQMVSHDISLFTFAKQMTIIVQSVAWQD
jgi:hypothetical protein